jgi:hypothetical protein
VNEVSQPSTESLSSAVPSELRPLCFVLMPFGKKTDANGMSIDFDAVYHELIAPAIEDAELEPVRADEEIGGGIIHKPMFERLILCDYAVADMTTANANVFYELGVRHAIRPYTTVLIAAEGGRPPFDVTMLRRLQYGLGASGGPANIEASRIALADQLRAARASATDSPIYQLLTDLPVPVIDRLKTEVFWDRVQYSERVKKRLAEARETNAEAVRDVDRGLGPIDQSEAGVVVALLLSYRAVEAWQDMVDLVARMAAPLSSTILVQEQLGFALNRLKRYGDAERVLNDVIARHGPSSESLGLLGRVYKDQWQVALAQKNRIAARGFLDLAIQTYRTGYEVDQRDPYPGINAVTLMEVRDPPDERRTELLPAVRYAVSVRLASARADYWDHASSLELAILAGDQEAAEQAAGAALATVREPWEAETTANNLRLIRTAREGRGDSRPWALDIENSLNAAGRRGAVDEESAPAPQT